MRLLHCRRAALPVLLAGAACAGERSASTPGVGDSAFAIPPLPDPRPIVARHAATLPPDQRVRAGACPFECCVYGDWTASGEIPVYASERGSGAPLFTLAPGQRFLADSGNVHVTGVLVVAVEDSVGDPPYWSFARGDTLVVLDYVGEGRYNVWQGGEVHEAEGFWNTGLTSARATTYGDWSTEWWVHVVLPDGRSGWFHAAPETEFAGADACG